MNCNMKFIKLNINDFLKFANGIEPVGCNNKNETVSINVDDWITLKHNAKLLFDSIPIDETDEQFIPFDKLIENGIGVGSILKTSNNNYYLIRDGFPKEFNVALCCNKLVNGDFHLYQLGFHWCGSTNSFKFRLITEYEKCCFIDTCVAVVMNAECYDENNDKWNAFNVADCSQILDSLYRYGLIDKVRYLMINDLIKRTHKVDLIKYFDKHYNGRAALYEMIN